LRHAAKDLGLIARGAQRPDGAADARWLRNNAEPMPRPAVTASGYLERL
jgi:hypothetical protein